MKYRILIVEDDDTIRKAVAEHLENWDFEVFCPADFNRIIEDFISFKPHIVLLDISLPYFDGFYWCKEIRKISPVPIVFISCANENMNIIMAITMGGDDFISKPFDLSVLRAKIQGILRRVYDYNLNQNHISYKDVCLNTRDHTVSYRNRSIELTRNEARILMCLLEKRGCIVSREKLMDVLWNSDVYISDNTLTVNVNRLRKKLDELGLQDFITTRFKEGYIIE